MANNEKIDTLQIPFPDFRLNDVIDPEQFDANNHTLQEKLNDMVARINAYLLDVENNMPGNSYYTKGEISSLLAIGFQSQQMLDGGTFHDMHLHSTTLDGGVFGEELDDKLIYDGGVF